MPDEVNPREVETSCVGIEAGSPCDPCAMVIFGASGDLTRRELVPALYELAWQDLLPDPFAVVGFARSDWSDEVFRERMRAAVEEECRFDEDRWRKFAGRLSYVQGDFTAPPEEDYARLRRRIEELRGAHDLPDNLFFHLATPAGFFEEIVGKLSAAGLAATDRGWRRLVIEKPFGKDEETARALDRRIREVFEEEQIYRIDHYLGKETVQNMLVFRFANPAFEPIWNRNYIDHVQITVAEELGIGTRGSFYERTGVVRDMIQNHLLQLLCMTAIEPPVRFGGAALRDETVKVLDAIAPIDLERDCVRGQYGPGRVDGESVRGYREEEEVSESSGTPTYAALRLSIDNWRWAGVPFYLRTGKRLKRKLTQVSLHFKPTPHLMFPLEEGRLHSNVLAFRLQPKEGVIRTFAAKQPGPDICIRPVRMNFLYANAFGIDVPPRAYAWLLHDVMRGDPTLFARADWIHRAWSVVDPVVEHWESEPPDDFPNYEAGSWGPAAGQELLGRDGREWTAV